MIRESQITPEDDRFGRGGAEAIALVVCADGRDVDATLDGILIGKGEVDHLDVPYDQEPLGQASEVAEISRCYLVVNRSGHTY